jgi:hypothetical protein
LGARSTTNLREVKCNCAEDDLEEKRREEKRRVRRRRRKRRREEMSLGFLPFPSLAFTPLLLFRQKQLEENCCRQVLEHEGGREKIN